MDIHSMLARINEAAIDADRASWSVSSLGDRLLRWDHRRRHGLAMRDEGYASEEDARTAPDGSTIISSSADGLTVEGFFEHLERMEELVPPGAADRAARLLASVRLGSLTGGVLRAWERATRGWDYSDVWNLDWALARRTGEQLLALADSTNGWPDSTHATFEEWTSALRLHGSALVAYATRDGLDELLEARYGRDSSASMREEAEAEYRVREEELAADASAAWRWVADNHQALWD